MERHSALSIGVVTMFAKCNHIFTPSTAAISNMCAIFTKSGTCKPTQLQLKTIKTRVNRGKFAIFS